MMGAQCGPVIQRGRRGENDPFAIVKQAMAPLFKGRQPAITNLLEAQAMLAKAEAEPAHAVPNWP